MTVAAIDNSGTNFWELATNPNAVNAKGKKRQAKLSAFVEKAAQKMGMDAADVIVQLYDHNPLFDFGGKAVYEDEMNQILVVGYLLLIKGKDIPQELAIQDLNDPCLLSNEHLNKVIEWVQTFLGMKENLLKGPAQRTAVQQLLILSKDPVKFEEAKKFVLAHEIGHLYHVHTHKKVEVFKTHPKKSMRLSMISGVLTTIIFKSCSGSTIGAALAGMTIAAISYPIAKKLLKTFVMHAHEKEADLVAKRAVGNEGGLYFYERCRAHFRLIRGTARKLSDKISMWMAIDSKGNDLRGIWSHPLFTTRESYLKA